MIDIRIIRERPDEVKHALELLNTSAPIDRIIELDADRRRLVTEVDQLKATRNEGSKAVSKAKDPDERNRLIAEMKQVSDAITVMDAQITDVDKEFNDLMPRHECITFDTIAFSSRHFKSPVWRHECE